MSDATAERRDASGRLDFLIGLVAVIGALAAIFWLIPLEVEVPAHSDQLSPRFFPQFSAIVVAILGVLLMIKSRRWALRRVSHQGPRIVVETLAWGAWATATMLMLEYAGFVAASAVSCFAATILAGQRWHLIWCALGLTGLAFGLDWLAWHAFYIELP